MEPHELPYGHPQFVSGYLKRLGQIQAQQHDLLHKIRLLEVRMKNGENIDPTSMRYQSTSQLHALLDEYTSQYKDLVAEEERIQNSFFPQKSEEEMPSLEQEFHSHLASMKSRGLL